MLLMLLTLLMLLMLLQDLPGGAPFNTPPSVLVQQLHSLNSTGQPASSSIAVQPVGNFLQAELACQQRMASPEAAAAVDQTQQRDESASWPVQEAQAAQEASTAADDSPHAVPKDVIAKWGSVLDIVTPESQSTNCFTKTYTRYAKVCLNVAPYNCTRRVIARPTGLLSRHLDMRSGCASVQVDAVSWLLKLVFASLVYCGKSHACILAASCCFMLALVLCEASDCLSNGTSACQNQAGHSYAPLLHLFIKSIIAAQSDLSIVVPRAVVQCSQLKT